ncbi:MAG: LD-carboxypeptidase [Gemmatimonadota bacterium]|nr:LD-carboxypeptidase [Gemmatimonadota bacterium]
MSTNIFGSIRPLDRGSRVALVAPAGVIWDPIHILRAEENVRSLGWTPLTGTHAASAFGYLAGRDTERLHDLNSALASDEIDAIWCVRGGYGAMRLLDDIDYESFRANPRPLIGFSDITALHSAFYSRCNAVTFHAPTARGILSEFSRASFCKALVEQSDSCGVAANGRELKPGRARGRLAGGNLALVTALLGTPFATKFEGALLVLEDIGEAVYRIDRMLRQLLLAGALQQCAGLVAGDFRLPANDDETPQQTIDGLLAEAADKADIPCLAGAPFGHITDQWTIPLGAIAELDTAEKSLRVVARV